MGPDSDEEEELKQEIIKNDTAITGIRFKTKTNSLSGHLRNEGKYEI